MNFPLSSHEQCICVCVCEFEYVYHMVHFYTFTLSPSHLPLPRFANSLQVNLKQLPVISSLSLTGCVCAATQLICSSINPTFSDPRGYTEEVHTFFFFFFLFFLFLFSVSSTRPSRILTFFTMYLTGVSWHTKAEMHSFGTEGWAQRERERRQARERTYNWNVALRERVRGKLIFCNSFTTC